CAFLALFFWIKINSFFSIFSNYWCFINSNWEFGGRKKNIYDLSVSSKNFCLCYFNKSLTFFSTSKLVARIWLASVIFIRSYPSCFILKSFFFSSFKLLFDKRHNTI